MHISDLHYSDELPRHTKFREKIVDRLREKGIRADCLIISGDLFNRGSLKKDKINEFKKYINGFGDGTKLVVPGNHDLDREARALADDSYNKYRSRRNIVVTKGNMVKAAGGTFDIEDTEKPILYLAAFQSFFDFSREMGFKSYNQDVTNPTTLVADVFEVQKYDYTSDDGYVIRFILLNTALIAGQAIRAADYRERFTDKVKSAQGEKDEVKAAEIRVEALKLKQEFEKHGELIIDNETWSTGDDESGRIAISKQGFESLDGFTKLETDERVDLFVFVGHHGFQYLSNETQKHLKRLMKDECKSGIYLCGHAHKESFRTFKLGNPINSVAQFQAGVMFEDDSGFSQYGFNHIRIQIQEQEPKLRVTATAHFCTVAPSNELCWMDEPINTDGCVYLSHDYFSNNSTAATEEYRAKVYSGEEDNNVADVADEENITNPSAQTRLDAPMERRNFYYYYNVKGDENNG